MKSFTTAIGYRRLAEQVGGRNGGSINTLPLTKTKSIKLTFVCTANLKVDLDRYAALHAQSYGDSVDAMMLIPHMLEAFMAGDRGFRKGRAIKAVSLKSS